MAELTDLTVAYEKVIFSSLFKRDPDVVQRRHRLKEELNTSNAFNNEYFVYYTMIGEQPKLPFDKDYVKLFVTLHRGIFERSNCVDLKQYTFGDTDAYLAFTDSCVTLFEECCKLDVADDQFELNLQKYKMVYIQRESINILESGAEILSSGKKVGYKVYNGYRDMRNYTTDQFNKLDKVVEKSRRKGAVAYGISDTDENDNAPLRQLGGYNIKALEGKLAIYEGEMHSILAPPKGGKSRFVTHVLESCLVDYKQNCLMWSMENGSAGWEYMFRARHFNRIYNSSITDVQQKKIISDADLRANRLSPELKELEEACWLAFKNSPEYGTLVNVDEDLEIDTFIDILDEQVTRYDVKIICVDYLQLIGRGKSNYTSKNELIGAAYQKMLQYIKSKKIAGLFPSQFKQIALGSLSRVTAAELANVELRDAGGETSEIIRTPDVNLALYGSVEDLRNGEVKLLSIPSRTMASFEPIDMYVDFGTSTWMSANK